MSFKPSRRAVIVAAISLCVMAVSALMFAPPLPARSQIDNSRVVVVEPGMLGLPRLPITAARLLPFANQFDWGLQGERQYSYSAAISLPLDQNLGIYVPFISAGGRLFVNGVPTGYAEMKHYAGPGIGDFGMLVRIPEAYLKPAFNRIDFVLEGDPRRVGLRQIYLDRYPAMAVAADRIDQWRARIQRAGFAGAIIGLTCSALSILLQRRIWLHLALAPASLLALAFGWVGLAPVWTSILIAAALGGIAIAMSLWSANGKSRPALFGGLLIAALVSIVAAVILNFGSVLPPYSVWLTGPANVGFLPLIGLGLPILLVGDAMGLRGELAQVRQLAAVQAALAQTAEAALQDEIRSHAVAEERQRFVRDMHDGIGGQMQSLLMRLRMKRIAIDDVEGEIAAGLVDLRLVTDSLDHVGNDLAQALATFQTRARQQLDAAEIAFDWQQSSDLAALHIDPRAILNVYRILQEALTNTVRHAGATSIAVLVEQLVDRRGFRIVYTDDGRGLPAPAATAGLGLKNMRARAAKLGAELELGTALSGHGFRMVLTWPAAPPIAL